MCVTIQVVWDGNEQEAETQIMELKEKKKG